ncbi:MAG: VWA domain-containing protein [Aeromicrobium sp.]|uniref:vWA domain-containing protein n=1 Tax=Aeromicrobium sp. TaxID=1871063 RepID=UPI0039E67B55
MSSWVWTRGRIAAVVAGALVPVVVAVVALVVVLNRGGGPAPDREADREVPAVPTVVVLDASASMLADDAPGVRFDAARAAVNSLVEGLPVSHELGLVVYGTGTGSSDAEQVAGCADVSTLIEPGPLDKGEFTSAVEGVTPSGFTPMGLALQTAAEQLPGSGERAVVVVSDGEDRCGELGLGPEPCEVAGDLAEAGVTVHTVGFKTGGNAAATGQLECVSEATGGLSLDAANPAQLEARLPAVLNPAWAATTIQPSGYRGVVPGMTVDEVRAAAEQAGEEFEADLAGSGTVEVVYVDCTLVFTDGVLTQVVSDDKSMQTLDGVGIGDDISDAEALYGLPDTPSVPEEDHTVIYAADEAAGTGYEITYKPKTTSEKLSGKITKIVLCKCAPVRTLTAEPRSASDVASYVGGDVVSDALTVRHPYLGELIVIAHRGGDDVYWENAAFISAFTPDGEEVWVSDPVSAYPSEDFGFAEPAADASGNLFAHFNPGRYDGTIVMRATPTGFEEVPQSRRDESGYLSEFYGSELIGPGADGLYVIRSASNDCTPDCAGGEMTYVDYRWDGSAYVR